MTGVCFFALAAPGKAKISATAKATIANEVIRGIRAVKWFVVVITALIDKRSHRCQTSAADLDVLTVEAIGPVAAGASVPGAAFNGVCPQNAPPRSSAQGLAPR